MSEAFKVLSFLLILSLPFIFLVLIWGILIGALAARKNRNGWLWGILCGVATPLSLYLLLLLPSVHPGTWAFFILAVLGTVSFTGNLGALLILVTLAYRCPRCKGKLTRQEWRKKFCPSCGEQTSVGRAGPLKGAFWWIFLFLILFFLLILLLPNTGLLDIHQ